MWFGCVPPAILAVGGGVLAASAWADASGWARGLGLLMLLAGLGIGAMLIWQSLVPRIAYRNGQVLFYLHGNSPIEVPVDIVEAFFLGQGPVQLAGIETKHEATNLVARLSQRHVEWARRDVKRALGNWCEGYVTIRGAWCEPLTSDVIRRLNRRLHEVKQNDAALVAAESPRTS